MELSVLGLLAQTVGAALLASVLLHLSRGDRHPALKAAGYAWVFLFLSLASLLMSFDVVLPYENVPYQYFKQLFLVLLIVAVLRMSREVRPAKPLVLALVLGLPVAAGVSYLTGQGSLFYSVHMAMLAFGWLAITVLVHRSRGLGLGKSFAQGLAALTTLTQVVYTVFFGISAVRGDQAFPFLAFTGFYDLFLQMFFGLGLIVWGMEDLESRLSLIHARALDDTQRSRRRVQIDPLTETYNRFFLEEIRPTLARTENGGSIVLIDVDGLKTINDQEGHEEGDKAIWTVAAAIKKLIRGDDYLIRWGGDEFLVILPGMDEELAKKRFYMLPAKIEEIRQSPNLTKAYRRFLAASVGVTPYSSRLPFDFAIESADRVMYERKKAHKEMRGATDTAMRRAATGSMRRVTTGDKPS
ncbi:MAG: diguanylate cyclase domain-containing protein [Thermoanaerobaculia bacterium]